MKLFNGEYYVEVKDKRYRIHPTEIIILRKRDPPLSLRFQYQVRKEIQLGKNQKVIRNGNKELVVKNYPKNKQTIQQELKFISRICPCCTRNNWLQFDKGYYCQKCEYINNKQKQQIDKKFVKKDNLFSSRLPYAN